MKKVTLLLSLILAALIGQAQMTALFFDQPVARYADLRDSILKALPHYSYTSIEDGKSGKSKTLFFSADTKKLEVSFSYFNDRIFLVTITGEFDELYSIFLHYLNDKASKEDILNRNCATAILQQLPDKKSLPISFCKTGTRWTLYDSMPH